ncbi:MAG TPA: sensor domain-containing diguanylate cyclase [Nocardioidaceae bacterium]|nr:sensor domain-containing diguanylate cyclase [Nocardioidaceae bacterium]
MPNLVDDVRLRGLAAVARSLSRSASLAVMVETAAQSALDALRAASVSISRIEAGTGSIRTLINVGRLGPTEQRWPHDEVYRLDDFLYLQSVVGELDTWTVDINDREADPAELELLRSLGKGSSMGAPLAVDGLLWGELYATRDVGDDSFDEADEAYTEALTAILGGAISRALHVDKLERMAFLDPLTGLANRRALDDATDTAFAPVAGLSVGRVSAVTFDVNGLKAVNDTSGHDEGDRLITRVSSLLFKHFADLPGSLVARVGGDEFTILVPGHDIARVVAAAEGACREASHLPTGQGLSCGVATTTERARHVGKQLLIAADTAQYEAKRRGHLHPMPAADPFGYELDSPNP